MNTIILSDGFNGHEVVCHSLPLAKDATTVKLRVYGSSLIKWVSLKEYEEACSFEVGMPDLPAIWIGSHYGDDNALEGHPAAYLVLTPIIENGVSKPVELVLESLDVSFSDIEDSEIVHDMISRWQRYADQHGYGFDYDMELYEYLDERHSWSYAGN
jgi:hypothetical protein